MFPKRVIEGPSNKIGMIQMISEDDPIKNTIDENVGFSTGMVEMKSYDIVLWKTRYGKYTILRYLRNNYRDSL